ncbi:ABC transporter permease subunit [Ferrimonas marina]|uniref:Cationic peptide transport system permease protein n=1 Tax=Ferrimonas marina TaxID=299255 RepID=A0A1M5Y8Q3_9GAMM|nr:ABC transporter permease subunit [Ferrimonas marina]SHI08336.1 cationic peptide transport system permease protein [Ferrimonas marina]
MLTYLIRRLNLLVLTTLVLMGLLYLALLNMPGSTATNLSGVTNPSDTVAQRISDRYQLESHPVQGYLAFVTARLSGDLGLSQASGQPVSEELARVMPATFELLGLALVWALLFGIPLGVLAASRRGPMPKLLWAGTLLGFSLPVFWLGILGMLTLGLGLDWLPPSGRLNLLYDVPTVTGLLLIDIPLSGEPWRWAALDDAIRHLLLPSLVLAVLPCTMVIRTIRAAMLAEMDKNYIRALKARGLRRGQLVVRHALPNSLAPMIRTLTLQLGQIVASAIIVESIFTWPGIGSWLLSSLSQGDYTALTGGILALSLVVIITTVALEVVQSLLNPVMRKEIYG